MIAACGKAPLGPPTTQPNLLMITFDTLRADHLGGYGSAANLTPNFDALAANSVMYPDAYAPSSTTGPSHATIFSGLHPNEHGVLKNGVPLSDDVVTISEILKEQGYSTAAFVSSYAVKSHFRLDQGFDLYDEDFNFPRRRLGGYTIEAASEWIAEQPNDKPWCVWVHLMDPHKPYKQPKEFLDPYITPDLTGHELAKASYNGAVAYTDSVLPGLLNSIRAQESAAGTLMAITADHGELFGEKGYYGHGTNLYEDVVRVPLIFNHHSLSPQIIDSSVVGLVDFSPTVLELLDVAHEVDMSGLSLVSNIKNGEQATRAVFMQRRIFDEDSIAPILEEIGANVEGPQWSVVHNGYKIIVAPDIDETELYHLENDPTEQHDLSEVKAESENLRRMQKILGDILEGQTLRASIDDLSAEVLQNLEQLGYAK